MGKKWSFKRKKGKIIKLNKIIVIVFIACLTVCFFKWVISIEPNIDKVAIIKAKAITNQQVNQALSQAVSQGRCKDLFIISKTDSGEASVVQADTEKINSLITSLVESLQKSYDDNVPTIIDVPLGTILGSKVLSEWGPSMKLKVKLMSVASMDYITDFENQGINQTKYRLFLNVSTKAVVLSPFYSNELELDNKVFVAETVIIGRVPDSYVVVPENEILETL